MANKIKKGDEVVVISGDHKGSKGKILQVIRTKNRVIVEGVNLIKKHERKT
ncbi:MAG: 50S ribosomal protein L24, partial [Verrucomicrobiota bacterium]